MEGQIKQELAQRPVNVAPTERLAGQARAGRMYDWSRQAEEWMEYE
jgi:hypothetical protein